MSGTLKTDEIYVEARKTVKGNNSLNIYTTFDPDMFVEVYLSNRELKALVNILQSLVEEEDE
ncbi:hypothetical protein [Enterococcus phage vB_Efm8_KEN21]